MNYIRYNEETGEWLEPWEWDDWEELIDENPVYDEYGYYIPLELREDTNNVK